MALSEIIMLGDRRLLEKSVTVKQEELPSLMPSVEKMWRLITEFREKYGRGRAIAAPQTGLMKRIICLNIDEPEVLINPVIENVSEEMMEVWDDCMSFPNLFVKLKRHRKITVSFYDRWWKRNSIDLEGDMSELIQHEYDHLDGILAISRAEDISCFRWVE
jgi:peptide deformylase